MPPRPSRTLGIDLSTDPKSTGACLLLWQRKRVSIEALEPSAGGGIELPRLVELIGIADKAGLDSPFGWPQPFIREITRWSKQKPWSADGRERLRYRATDLEVRGKPRLPLSVSTERLGATAMACAELLNRVEDVDRSGLMGPVAEVYPAAALHSWEIKATGYKQDTKASRRARRQVLDGLKAALGSALTLSPAVERRMLAEHDLLDAFVCALAARAVQIGETARPPEELQALAQVEGWIHVPACEIRALL